MLRPTVSRHPSGAYDQIFITVGQLRVCWCGALSLTGGRVCRLQLLLALASAVILWSEPTPPYSILCPLIIPRHGPHGKHLLLVIRNALLFVLYLATSYSAVHREHNFCWCMFAGTCILSRCPAMDICVTILKPMRIIIWRNVLDLSGSRSISSRCWTR
jgi:hypothetical protein